MSDTILKDFNDHSTVEFRQLVSSYSVRATQVPSFIHTWNPGLCPMHAVMTVFETTHERYLLHFNDILYTIVSYMSNMHKRH